MADRSLSTARRMLMAAAAVLTWSALALQLDVSLSLAVLHGRSLGSGLVSFFGFFTVLTNLLVALVFAAEAGLSKKTSFLRRADLQSAAAVYVVIVSVVYTVLLQHLAAESGPRWLADVLLHYVIPPIYLLYWLVSVPKGTLRWVDPLRWLAYPLAYFAASLARGALTGIYPYPFLNVQLLGFEHLAINAVALLAAFTAVSCLCVALDRALARATITAPASASRAPRSASG
jgi:hypothetical protein